MKRRAIISGLTGATLGSLPTKNYALGLDPGDTELEVKVGLIADLHFGNLAPDGVDRFKDFKKAVKRERPDHVVQLGDFCFGEKRAGKLMAEWNAMKVDKYHVLGNHDMDKNTKAEIQKFWGMKSRYYHFDQGGWRFIVLDMNHLKKGDDYIPYGNANFYVDPSMRTWADPTQLVWLKKTLADSQLPVIIYTHQPIGHRPESPQQRPILEIIKTQKTKSNRPKTRAVICGHEHQDWHLERDGIHHLCINSASYLWKDGKPWAYNDALFTFMEIKKGVLSLTGRETNWKERPEGVKNKPAISERGIEIQ